MTWLRLGKWLRLGALIIAASVLAWTAFILFEPAAAYQLNISETSWRVVAIRDHGIRRPRSHRQIRVVRGTSNCVATRCGTNSGAYDIDSDGSAMLIQIGDGSTKLDCSAADQESDAALLKALNEVRGWRVVTGDRIELLGDDHSVLVELERLDDSS